jgi:hypothetical protein
MHTRARSIRRMAAAVAVVLAAATGACGSSNHSPPPGCLQFAPCGGDVVGTWSFLGTCTDIAGQSALLAAACPGAAINAFGVSITGTFTFNADSSYTASNWHEVFVATETLPLSCAGGTTCADGNGTETDTTGGSTVNVTTTCTGTSTCACRVNGTFDVSSDVGTWTTTGTALTMDGVATSTSLSYCVEDNRLHLMQINTTATGQTTTVSDIVAVRSP